MSKYVSLIITVFVSDIVLLLFLFIAISLFQSVKKTKTFPVWFYNDLFTRLLNKNC